ncbi:MAG: SH3 domain-containing protein [Leptolyngbya sp. SIO1E4]|nr:SH3 domain-containing protein [Leptolyngbya sp. SIO1E4]
MKQTLTGLSITAITCLIVTIPAQAQTIEVCPVVDDYVPAGEAFLYPEPEPGYIDGEEPGSRVNVRTGPGTEYEASAYGLVGDSINVIGQAFSSECETWIKVRFLESEFEGWIHAQFIKLPYARGWWD